MGGDIGMVPMRDHEKAKANANFKVDAKKLISICDAYKKRKYIEELDILTNELGGTEGLLDALQIDDYNRGISAESLDVRERVFGTNHKEPPGRTGFCKMVLEALDDFMLKLLIVAAVFSILVEIGFNIQDPQKLATAWIEGFAILVAVSVVALVSAWSDYKKEGQFLAQQKLEELSKNVSDI
jgi:magnesium-transporting ATPase (P-type)